MARRDAADILRNLGRGRGRGRGGNREFASLEQVPWKRILGFKKLEELQNKDANDIVLTLDKYKEQLEKALAQTTADSDKTVYLLFLHCLSKCCECESLPNQIVNIFHIVENSEFLNDFVGIVEDMMNEIGRPRRQIECRQQLRQILTILTRMNDMLPKSKLKIRGILSTIDTFVNVLKSDSAILDDELWEMYEALMSRKHERKSNTNRRQQFYADDEEEPEGDFREFPLFPTTEEVKAPKPPKLRRNKTDEGYESLDQYLDTQYRLLREDFIAPLREGIREYMEAVHAQTPAKKLHEIRIYRDVQIISPVCNNHGLCKRVSFYYPRMNKLRWESSKHLIYGSLVCLSSDNFQTVWFATVADRDLKNVRKGLIDIKFEKDYEEVSQIPPDTKFVMAETTAYFEAYKHVLVGLQRFREGDLPFSDYIVKLESEVKEPTYISRIPGRRYDLRPLVDEDIVLDDRNIDDDETGYKFSDAADDAKGIIVQDQRSWPPPELLHLDITQLRAVETALSKEFAVIQGPPGTGKTYIGLKIMKALLHNKHIWSINPDTGIEEKRPILVVCYTNHALDQFLEGIVGIYGGEVLRLGSRSSSEILQPLSIVSKRRTMRMNRDVPLEIHSSKMDVKHGMNSLKEEVNKIADRIEKAKREILHEDAIKHVMGDLYDQLREGFESIVHDVYGLEVKEEVLVKQSAILEWLGFGEFLGFEPQFAEHTTKEETSQIDQGPGDENGVNAQRFDAERRPNDFINVLDENDVEIANRRTTIVDSDSEDENDDMDEVLKRILEENVPLVALDVSELDLNLRKPKEEGMRWKKLNKKDKGLKKRIREKLASNDRMSEDDVNNINHFVWDLLPDDRWRLYRYWLKTYCEDLQDRIKDKELKFEQTCKEYQDIIMQEDRFIMKKSTVIGLTTTCAARYQAVLQEIGPRIIIVEEAAEVLEGHVITTLSRRCEHLILIGDHKQLKPKPTVYKLAKDYNLNLSLFERMACNNIDIKSLSLQHRMRPEMSQMMKIIYPDLKDHEIVKNYESVRGVSGDIFFINHSEHESPETDLRSHSNKHEAEYLVQLCRYLLLQGYKPQQITVLTTYSGQLHELKYNMPKDEFEGVRVTVVDNYQGEENDIVLLSLVRSNPDGTIGFLKEDNRLCVAMSRAKIGLYVIGNFDMLADKSPTWREFVNHAQKKKFIGKSLRLYCENHPDATEAAIQAEYPSDFKRSPGGGCKRPCEKRLKCGHTCPMVCHHTDREHKDVQCSKPCIKTCPNGHRCNRRCNQDCTKCEKLIEKTIPKCGHKQEMPCYLNPADFICKNTCDKDLPCGHKCEKACGEKHTEKCNIHVEKQGKCSHFTSVPCHTKKTNVCPNPCNEVLECGHRCTGTCGDCHNGRLHKRCEEPCKRILVCEHPCKDKCNNCPPCKERCQNRCVHNFCGEQCGDECAPCAEDCDWKCDHYKCGQICCSPCDRPRCDKPCKKKLRCGHDCIGLCGEPCPKPCRTCDSDHETFKVLFGNEDEPDAMFVELEDCGHVFEVTSLDKWMDEVKDEQIKLKVCPKCRTPIRKNLRYGNIIKETLHNIEIVKQRMLGRKSEIKDLEKTINRTIYDLEDTDARRVKKLHNDLTKGAKDESTLRTLVEQIKILKIVTDLRKKLGTNEGRSGRYEEMYTKALGEIDVVFEFTLLARNYFTKQETDDLVRELDRIRLLHRFLRFKERKTLLEKQLEREQSLDFMVAEQHLTDGQKFTRKKQDEVEKTLEALKDVIPLTGLGISEDERIQIVNAMGLTQGHWFKCRMGHVYAIGDCGGATEETRCPECRGEIGGTQHRLRDDNSVATEMDGAQHGAWSAAGDLGNYDPFEVRFL